MSRSSSNMDQQRVKKMFVIMSKYPLITPPRNRGGVIFSLQFVCVCVSLCVSVCLGVCVCVCVCVFVCV